jgi:alpha-L-rhamnosidase
VGQQATHSVGGDAVEPQGSVSVALIRFEHRRDALGIGTARPRLSWVIVTERPNWQQAGYEVVTASADGQVQDGTGRVESGDSILVPWPFEPLRSRERCNLQVRVWGTDGSTSDWSSLYAVEAGLLDESDWTAQFVGPDWEEDVNKPSPSPLLRREFAVKAGLSRARLYITSLGVHEAQLNGAVIGDEILNPGWTSYHHRLQYSTFDVTLMLREGSNVIGAVLGDGWYRGRIGFNGGRRNYYGDRLALLAQLELAYEDGTTEFVISDKSWRVAAGPVQASDIYDGEEYDARQERDGWAEPGYDDSDWARVAIVPRDLGSLVAPLGPPVRRTENVAPIDILRSPSGKAIVDFGQNVVGRVRLTVQGEAGQTITMRHAEVLEHGELGTRPLRTAKATDRYTLKGDESETWEPLFTFHGFRYVEVTGWPGEIRKEDLSAVVLHSDFERTGWFASSDALLDRLHENVLWSMRGNFLSIPTDCPQRDERLGWTGDIQVFAPTATFLGDVAGFLQSWLADLAAEQRDANGVVPAVVPNVIDKLVVPAAAWGDAAVVVPWVLFKRNGDAAIVEQQFESMRSWVDVIARLAGDDYLWDEGFQFGDWLDPDAPPDAPAAGRTSADLVATAYFAHSAQLTGEAAGIIQRSEERSFYLELASKVRQAFATAFLEADGSVRGESTTAHALALQFNLLPNEAARKRSGERLAELVRESGYHISTGFVGTPLVCDALCSAGEYEVAYRLLMQRECPSWLYPVTMGATTIWERWDSMRPDGSINPGEMTSFNHYALGAVADWLHRVVAGLAPVEPGYRRIQIRPIPGGGLTHACARHETPYGLAESRWEVMDGTFRLDAIVPPNSTADVYLPGAAGSSRRPIVVGSGRHQWSVPLEPGDESDIAGEGTIE